MWKPTSHEMATKVSQIASWVPMHLLPGAQCKRWILIGSMGCVHTHQGMPAIEDVYYVQLKNNLVGVKVQGACNAMEHYFIIIYNCNSKLVWGKMCYKNFTKLKT
jgi:hypothetical protein